MARCLCVVEDTFELRGRGLVFVPGIIPEGDERFRVGDLIRLRRPDGSSSDVAIGGIEMINRPIPVSDCDLIILLKNMKKEDVPVGTEVWSVDL